MRVKRGLAAHRRHKKYLDMAKGFRGGRSRLGKALFKLTGQSIELFEKIHVGTLSGCARGVPVSEI